MSSRPFSLEHHSRLGLLLLGGPLAAVLLAATPAAAADDAQSNCPPGSWFCADAAEKPAAQPRPAPKPAPKPAPVVAADDEEGELAPLPPAPPPVRYRPPPPPPPPVVVYQQPPPPPAYYYYRPRPPKPVGQPNEWGLNLRAEGAITGGGSQSTRPMEGVGLGLRYRPAPAFALEAGFDFLNGRDYYNNFRNETEFTVNAMVFVNPKSRVQVYFLAGLGGAWANVENDSSSSFNDSNYTGRTSYTYFGGQAGGGLEFRIAKHFAMNADLRGFIRSRTDSNSSVTPEYVDPVTHQTTNTSDGCLVTGGMTFYF